jgi:hypothetical protein
MDHVVKSVRAFTHVVGAVIGGCTASPTNETLRQYPHLGYYR